MRKLLILVIIIMIPCIVSCGDGRDETVATEVFEELESAEENTETEGSEDLDAGSGLIPEKERPVVKGIYVTGPVAGSERMNDLITLVDATELNTMVIDVKNDEGEITWKMDSGSVLEMGNGVAYIRDISALMETLKEHNIYTIARIVCFKDPVFAQNHTDCALRKPDGGFVTDAYGLAWVNPYEEEVWAYLAEIAQAALDAGFDEIQFDYVRFPIGSDADAADYKVDMTVNTKEQAISDFLSYASEQIHKKGGVVTADVFGTVIDSPTDIERVGQNYAELGKRVDVLSPMVYPSHYGPGVFGFDVPDAHPYDTVYQALMLSQKVLGQDTGEACAIVRPWLQAFTATWVSGHISYEGEQIREQIQAVYDAGYEEWILWNATCRYPMDILSDEQAKEE
ncbi:MAG: putative glycoside hydrolase [Lachnospiraceae bacterium]|nr:putative glycoside hydrolase [Lachnospiraceae bacterium]